MHEAVLKRKEVSSSVLSLTFEWNHEMGPWINTAISSVILLLDIHVLVVLVFTLHLSPLSHTCTHSAETPLPVRHMKRYPKRVNDRKQYQEDELSDEDEYLCKEWQNEFHGYI